MEWICLRVKIIYDNGDDTWLVYSNVEGNWYIAYHGGIDIPKKMLENGFQTRSSKQIYKYKDNMNPLKMRKYLSVMKVFMSLLLLKKQKDKVSSLEESNLEEIYTIWFLCVELILIKLGL